MMQGIGPSTGAAVESALTRGASASESPIIRSVSEALISLTLAITTSISKALAGSRAKASASAASRRIS